MRVPVHPNDLIRNCGMKRIAKKLQKQWPGPNPLGHTSALELVSQGLGYKHYHDLAASANEQKRPEILPPLSDLKKALMLAIKAAMSPSDWFATDQEAMAQLIDSLHFGALYFYKEPKSVFQHPRHSLDQSKVSELADLRAQMAESARELSSPDYWLTEEEIASIKRVAASTDNLRDRALMSCMLAGLRRSECLLAKPSDFSELDRRMRYTSPSSKKARVFLSQELWMPISLHISTAKLAEDDLLFASRSNPGKPMSPPLLQKLCETWATLAGVEEAKVTPHTLFRSIRRIAARKALSINDWSGHFSTESMAKYYLDSTSETKLSE
ncbi:MAG: tyrosine-type recombinase/integrase [Pseudomonas sp.]|uniref:tyrosine-type recombinase/integrase n=1 Tax=Pseudomonas TaxID=286 RepID=UPI0005A50D8D|nr:tyrosine-type recombinase/integrase [Pseudomonas sp. VLB120]